MASAPGAAAAPRVVPLVKQSGSRWSQPGSRPQDIFTFAFQTVCWCWFVKVPRWLPLQDSPAALLPCDMCLADSLRDAAATGGQVWMWHFSNAAKVLPGATGFGWFFRYLTFFGFTIQTFTLTLSVFASCTLSAKNISLGRGQRVRDLADNFSSAAFGLANVVTVMFHIVRVMRGPDSAVEGGHIERPFWLGFTVHNMNVIVAWVHLLLSPHSFSPSARKLSVSFMLTYVVWIQVCQHMNGSWPYPILNALPYPWGFIGLAGLACLIFLAMFEIGRAVKRTVGLRGAGHVKAA